MDLGLEAYDVVVPLRSLDLQFRGQVYIAHIVELGNTIMLFH